MRRSFAAWGLGRCLVSQSWMILQGIVDNNNNNGKYIQQIPAGNIKNELQRITPFKTLRLVTRHKFIFTALFLRSFLGIMKQIIQTEHN